MIVDEPPYQLVAVFADADAKFLVEGFIERGQVRQCLHRLRWRSLRDARRDAFRADPAAVLAPFRQYNDCRFILCWDHWGSGAWDASPQTAEEAVYMRLERVGFNREDIFVVAFVPEVEKLFVPAWSRVKEVLAEVRQIDLPDDENILQILRERRRTTGRPEVDSVSEALEQRPKDMFKALVSAVGLRSSPQHYRTLGQQLSIPAIKQNPQGRRLLKRLRAWFPGEGWTG